MEVYLHNSARKYLGNLEKNIQNKIKEHIKVLSQDPYSTRLDIKKLKGLQNKPDIFRLRVGEYRVIYFVQDKKIWVTEVMIRGIGYDF
ncbi:type II toxin-antitoxin system RelE/ParE family toxin [archaeon]|nr:type II toxin-antitoxin system RelE/ParE family toxin [archaeon]